MYKIFDDHPLIKDKLTKMRQKESNTLTFRSNMIELTQLMFYEATRNLEVESFDINTPIIDNVKNGGYKIKHPLVLIAILRAGLGMTDAIKGLIPNCSIGHIGLQRNEETLKPEQYYYKLPDIIDESYVFVCDPMLATAGSAIATIDLIKKEKPKKIIFIGILGAKEGLEKLMKVHPDVDIYLAGLDEKLNENGYIVPGLGDAGDRIFGTFRK